MDERNLDRIDRFIRKEMMPDERLNFEQDALNNDELRKETEVTYLLKQSLKDRSQKLKQTAEWGKKKQKRYTTVATITSIAAMFVVGLYIWLPYQKEKDISGELIAKVGSASESITIEQKKNVIENAKKAIADASDKEVVETVEKLEKGNVIPSISDVSDGIVTMSNALTEENFPIQEDVYELHWQKINSLIRIGEENEAMELLKSFVTVDGKYKATADSLLNSMK